MMNRLLDTPVQVLGERRRVPVAIQRRGGAVNRHPPVPIQRVPDERADRGRVGGKHAVVAAPIAEHHRRDREQHPWGRKAQPGQQVMNQKAMDASVAVFERVNQYEAERGGGRGANRIDFGLIQPAEHGHPVLHERPNIFRLGTHIMDVLGEIAARLADEILDGPPGALRVTRIDDRVLQPDKGVGIERVEVGRRGERRHKAFGTVGARRFAFDRVGRFRFFGIEIMHGARQHAWIAAFHKRARLSIEAGLLEAQKRVGAPDQRTVPGVAKEVVVQALPPDAERRSRHVSLRIEEIRVPRGRHVVHVQSGSGQEFIQVPGTTREDPRVFFPDPVLEKFTIHRRIHGLQHTQVHRFVPHRELQMAQERFGSVEGRIVLEDGPIIGDPGPTSSGDHFRSCGR